MTNEVTNKQEIIIKQDGNRQEVIVKFAKRDEQEDRNVNRDILINRVKASLYSIKYSEYLLKTEISTNRKLYEIHSKLRFAKYNTKEELEDLVYNLALFIILFDKLKEMFNEKLKEYNLEFEDLEMYILDDKIVLKYQDKIRYSIEIYKLRNMIDEKDKKLFEDVLVDLKVLFLFNKFI